MTTTIAVADVDSLRAALQRIQDRVRDRVSGDRAAPADELDDISARLQRLAIGETDPVLAARIRLLARHCDDASALFRQA
jgi:hypothetical protein